MMNCDECGDGIFVGDEYFHDCATDENFHLSCVSEQDQEARFLDKRYREE